MASSDDCPGLEGGAVMRNYAGFTPARLQMIVARRPRSISTGKLDFPEIEPAPRATPRLRSRALPPFMGSVALPSGGSDAAYGLLASARYLTTEEANMTATGAQSLRQLNTDPAQAMAGGLAHVRDLGHAKDAGEFAHLAAEFQAPPDALHRVAASLLRFSLPVEGLQRLPFDRDARDEFVELSAARLVGFVEFTVERTNCAEASVQSRNEDGKIKRERQSLPNLDPSGCLELDGCMGCGPT